MDLVVIGLNHRSASLALREQLVVPPRDLPDVLRALHAEPSIDEAVLLSTCNRVELYVASQDPATAVQAAIDFFASRSNVASETLRASLYCFLRRDAVAHLFRVTAGLDSMILGESEITAQVKQAYLAAQAQGTTGPLLHRLFQKALHAAKEVRSRTGIGQGHASIGSATVTLARTLFDGRLENCDVLLWGAGKAAESTARHLIKQGVRQLWIVNRTQFKAQDLASLCQSGWISWEQARAHLAKVDIAIVCTQAPHYVIDAGDLAAILPQRHGRPLCLIDLAVPRNVDPALKRQAGIALYNIDDLQGLAQDGLAARQDEQARCTELLAHHVRYFLDRGISIPMQEEAVA